jgi:hypothetical protein
MKALVLRSGLALLGLALPAWLAGCGDEVQGRVRLLVVPHHQGRGAVQDPFQLVRQVEVGLTDAQGGHRSLGQGAPLASFGPGLVSEGLVGAPTLVGRNERGRAVSLGYGAPLRLAAGLETSRSVAFCRLDHAVARPSPEGVTDEVPGQLPPALRLELQNLETGSLTDPLDAGALVWLAWRPEALVVWIRVVDDDVRPAASGLPLETGDALRVYLDAEADGLGEGPHDRIWTVAADGRVSPEDARSHVSVSARTGGYDVRLELPIPPARKNALLGFDLRLWDVDAQGPASVLTWVFDPRAQGAEPSPAEYGRIVLAPALLDLLPASEGFPDEASLAGSDGLVVLSGDWSPAALRLEVQVPDDSVRPSGQGPALVGADRVELWLDLANGEPPAPERHRFHRLVIAAGGAATHAAGPSPEAVGEAGVAFTGQARGIQTGQGYRVELELPWADLDLPAGPGRGWFLGLEVVVQDEDGAGARASAWSGHPGSPWLWNELRLFTLQE